MSGEWFARMLEVISFLVKFVFIPASIILQVLLLLTLHRALSRCRVECRRLSPGLVWLCLVPVFYLIWQFIVVLRVAESLGAEFQKRNVVVELNPGQRAGLAVCIATLCSTLISIPLGSWMCMAIICPETGVEYVPMCAFTLFLLGGVEFVCGVVYLVKVSGFSTRLDHLPATASVVNPTLSQQPR